MTEVASRSHLPSGLSRFLAVSFYLYVVSIASTMSGMEIFSGLLSVGMIAAFFISRKRGMPAWGAPPFLFPLLAFVGVAILGIVCGQPSWKEKLYDLGRLRFFFLYVVLFYYLRYQQRSAEANASPAGVRPHRWIIVLLGITCVVGLYGFIQHFVAIDIIRPEGKKVLMYAIPGPGGKGGIGPLVVGAFNHHLTFSNVYLMYACFFTSMGLASKKIGGLPSPRWFLLLGLFLFLLCVWTESRAAWIAIPICLGFIMGQRNRLLGVAVLVGAVLALSAVYFTDAGFHQRFDRTFLQKDDFYNLGPRTRLWKAQWEFFKSSPLFGVGYDNNERYCRPMMERLYPKSDEIFCGHAHSMPLQILATTGIFGVITFAWLWASIFTAGSQLMRRSDEYEHWAGIGIVAAFIGFWIQGMTQWNFGDAEVIHNVMFFWAVLGVAAKR